MDDDFYAAWYGAKLWQSLPAIYRTLDAADPTATPEIPGPLQELFTRIGGQAATLRRSIDRLWDNQSIESCDDWVIPYIGQLMATRIVSCLPARAQRLDVAKTIYYRRRAGTLGLIEELASDIAGHDARAVEFFRRLGRTRHNFDPPIGLVPNLSIYPDDVTLLKGPPAASVIEGLSGATTGTPAGGYADLRNAYGAANAGTAFDEFAYTTDFRAGRQSIGWMNISHLGVFVWWLYAYPVTGGTPVQRAGSPNQFTFDPTGRETPLFAPSQRAREDWADNWVTPNEWELPVAVRRTLWALLPDALYPKAFSVAVGEGALPPVQLATSLVIDPERGTFCFKGAPPAASVAVTYNFGFSSTVGAGTVGAVLPALATPAAVVSLSAGAGLEAALGGLAADGTVVFTDSTTFAGPVTDPGANAVPPVNFALVAAPGTRPVLRWTAPGAWTLTGHGGALVLQGLWLQGADLILAGAWDSVTLRLCTLDPGTADPANAGGVLTAADGVALAPTHLFIDGQVARLVVQNCVTGPIAPRNGGAFAALTISDSIVQAIAQKMNFDPPPQDNLLPHHPPPQPPENAAIAAEAGEVSLTRTTILGRLRLHELSASECILDDIATVENSQEGCVRFSTLARGHNLHAPFRCATVPRVSGIIESRDFGRPNYARVSAGADLAILPAPHAQPPASVLYGAANGAQPGAFCAEQQALAQRGLALKLQEYTPAGLIPVWVDADLNLPKNKGTP